jgi:beta-N-acetylhexosaminidase
VLAAAVGVVLVATPAARVSSARATRATSPSTRELIGQRLVVAMSGQQASPALLGRIRRGEIGGIVLFGFNIASPSQLQRLTAQLQGAARAAGRPPLLIATDQEGGGVRRLPWAGPSESASVLGRSSTAQITREALVVGQALKAAGVDVDLAPVADVPAAGSFMAADRRTFAATAPLVAKDVVAFARGLAAAHVAATVKHFPGIGRATRNTDLNEVEITASRSALDRDLQPFRAAVGAGAPLVMISNATYPALDSKPAPWSPRVQSLLRGELGFKGVTISDALDGAAKTRGRMLPSVSVLAAQAGVDLILLTGSESSSAAVFDALVAAAGRGALPTGSLQRSYDRIQALKAAYG